MLLNFYSAATVPTESVATTDQPAGSTLTMSEETEWNETSTGHSEKSSTGNPYLVF